MLPAGDVTAYDNHRQAVAYWQDTYMVRAVSPEHTAAMKVAAPAHNGMSSQHASHSGVDKQCTGTRGRQGVGQEGQGYGTRGRKGVGQGQGYGTRGR